MDPRRAGWSRAIRSGREPYRRAEVRYGFQYSAMKTSEARISSTRSATTVLLRRVVSAGSSLGAAARVRYERLHSSGVKCFTRRRAGAG